MTVPKKKAKSRAEKERNKIRRDAERVQVEVKEDGRSVDTRQTRGGDYMEHDFKGTIHDPDGDWVVRGKMMWD